MTIEHALDTAAERPWSISVHDATRYKKKLSFA